MITPAIPTTEPYELPAGDTWTWTKSLPNYPATEWTLSYELLLLDAAATNITITATADGTDHLVDESPTTTAPYAPGKYKYKAYATNNSDGRRFTVDTGHFNVTPDFATSTEDPRSVVKRTLDALEEMLLGKASADKLKWKIGGPGGTEIEKLTPSELLEWRNVYRNLYQEELAQLDGNTDVEVMQVEFVQP